MFGIAIKIIIESVWNHQQSKTVHIMKWALEVGKEKPEKKTIQTLGVELTDIQFTIPNEILFIQVLTLCTEFDARFHFNVSNKITLALNLRPI